MAAAFQDLDAHENDTEASRDLPVVSNEIYTPQYCDTVPIPVCIVHDGIFVFCNSAALRLTGYSSLDIINKHVSVVFSEQNAVPSFNIKDSDSQDTSLEYTCSIRTKKHADMTLACTQKPVSWQGKKSSVIFAVPLPESAHPASGCRANDYNFELMYKHAPVGVYRTAPDGSILLANPELVSMLGYASFEELARNNIEADPTYTDYSRSMFKKDIEKQGVIKGLESHWRKKDGTYIHVRESACLVRNSDGTPAYYDGIVEDITDRIMAEQWRGSIKNLSQAALELNSCQHEDDIFLMLGKQLKGIIGPNACICVNSVEALHGDLRVEAILGIEQHYSKLVSFFGIDPSEMVFNVNDAVPEYIQDGKLHQNARDLYSILHCTIPQKITTYIKKMLKIKIFYSIGLVNNNTVLGTVIIGLKSDYSGSIDSNIVEAFVSQAAIALQRKQAEKKIKHLNRVLQAIQAIDQVIINERHRKKLIERVCCILVEKRGYSSAWIVLVDKYRRVQSYASSGMDRELFSVLELFRRGKLIECWKRAFDSPGIVFIKNTAQECGSCPLLGAEPSERTFTIRLEYSQRIFGLLSLSIPLSLSVDEEEQSLFEEFAADLSLALCRIQLEEENIRAHEDLRKSEDRLSKTILAANDGTWDWDLNTSDVFFDARYFQMAGYQIDEFPHQLDEYWSRIHPDDTVAVMMAAEKHLEGETDRFSVEFRFRTRTCEWMWIKGKGLIVERDEHGKPLRFVGTHTDITERKRIEQALKRSEEKYRTIFESSSDAIFTIIDGVFIDCNNATMRMFNCTRDEIIGKPPEDFSPDIQPDGRTSAEAASCYLAGILNGEPQSFEWKSRTSDGIVFTVEINLNTFTLGEETYIQAMVRSIEERKKAERELKKSLAEKDVLLKEIHHRVKNNMQVVHSLLGLQEHNLDDKRAVELFEETRGRVYVMARVHEMLYRSENFSEINFKEYLKHMTNEMLHSSTVSSLITLKQDIEDVCININLAIPCGLILNELITNALKHGFPNREKGILSVGFKRKGENAVRMQVSDNGVGLPESIDADKGKTFGLRLVNLLTEQLEGSLCINRAHGTTFTIDFPLEQ